MKVQDLRIGNYIIYEATTHIVSAIGRSGVYSWWVKDGEPVIEYYVKDAGGVQVVNPYFDQISNYEPIPITEEWLLKFGFEKSFDTNFTLEFLHHELEINISGYGTWLNTQDIVSVKYVHQLQNLYFALTGEELTIKE
jgi:hypothetical protein